MVQAVEIFLLVYSEVVQPHDVSAHCEDCPGLGLVKEGGRGGADGVVEVGKLPVVDRVFQPVQGARDVHFLLCCHLGALVGR